MSNKQLFSSARYESQLNRSKERLARKLLQIAYPSSEIKFMGSNCHIDNPEMTYISNYASVVCDYVPSSAWEKLPVSDRYKALDLLVPQVYHTPVPGGMVYQVRFASKASKVKTDEWVFLTVGHAIGRCKLVPQDWLLVSSKNINPIYLRINNEWYQK